MSSEGKGERREGILVSEENFLVSRLAESVNKNAKLKKKKRLDKKNPTFPSVHLKSQKGRKQFCAAM